LDQLNRSRRFSWLAGAHRAPAGTITGSVDRHNHRHEGDYYPQPGNLHRPMPKDAQQRLINNLVGRLSGAPKRIQELQVKHFYKANPDCGTGVAKGLGLDTSKLASDDNMIMAD
jgi:catalase